MYTLRRITKSETDNIWLGRNYSVIKESDNLKEFEELQKNTEGSNLNEITYGYVKDEDGRALPLHNTNTYYIVTESGSTFERL